jgi:hypothetical protein
MHFEQVRLQEGGSRSLFKEFFIEFAEKSEGKQEKPQSRCLVNRSIIEPSIFRIQAC